ncbi:MAG: NADH-quinone oxidoreductase subunit C [SAR324 cluster bacterium]|nr:NADH-quinone oxidoreductase subunit C [SAR324 cluster bacterium]
MTAPEKPQTPALTALIEEAFPGAVTARHTQHGDETVVIERKGMLEVLRFLRDDPRCRFDMMVDVTAVDYLPRAPRFEVVYHLKSLQFGHRLRVKVAVPEENPVVDSIQPLWVAADWYERECAEMYGIRFEGHPKPEFLLLYEGFEGHPLRKDYQKLLMQPLVPMRPIAERHDYGEVFQYVKNRPEPSPEKETP